MKLLELSIKTGFYFFLKGHVTFSSALCSYTVTAVTCSAVSALCKCVGVFALVHSTNPAVPQCVILLEENGGDKEAFRSLIFVSELSFQQIVCRDTRR